MSKANWEISLVCAQYCGWERKDRVSNWTSEDLQVVECPRCKSRDVLISIERSWEWRERAAQAQGKVLPETRLGQRRTTE